MCDCKDHSHSFQETVDKNDYKSIELNLATNAFEESVMDGVTEKVQISPSSCILKYIKHIGNKQHIVSDSCDNYYIVRTENILAFC